MGWINAGTADTLAVHAALLPSGQILYFGGSDYDFTNHDQGLFDHSRLFDCQTYAITKVGSPDKDAFCCGHCLLEGGRLLVGGGTQFYGGNGMVSPVHHDHWPGLLDAWIFDGQSRQWTKLPPMHGGRWYPTLVTLADGRALALCGHPENTDYTRHINNTPDLYAPKENCWLLQNELGDRGHEAYPPLGTPDFQVQYPRVHVLPSGEVFFVTPLFEGTPSSLRYHPDTQQHTFVGGDDPDPDFLPSALVAGHNTTSVLLPYLLSRGYRSSVLLCGAQRPLRIELDDPNPAWRGTGTRALAGSPLRYNLNAVLLPTGDVFICGGINDAVTKLDANAVLTPEIYHPETDTWETAEPATVVRNYHSVALLMPDGRVWTAGGNKNGAQSGIDDHNVHEDTHEPGIEIYEPWYHFRPRPQIAGCPPGMQYRRSPLADFSFKIATPDAPRIKRVAVVRTASTTHAFSSDQRYVELAFRLDNANELSVTPPVPGGLAPAGDYLLFILDQNGVPSHGCCVWIGEQAPHPPGYGPKNLTRPLAIQNSDGRIELFVVGGDKALWHRWQTAPNAAFADWDSLDGGVSQPCVIQNQDGCIQVFAVGQDQGLWYRRQVAPNGPFAPWDTLGGGVSEPFAIQNQDGRIEIFAVGLDQVLWHCWQTGPNAGFAPWVSFGGPAVKQPFAIHNQDGRIELFAVRSDGVLIHCWQTAPNGPFAGWVAFDGKVSQPFAVANQDGRIELFAINLDGTLVHRWQIAPNAAFAEWTPMS